MVDKGSNEDVYVQCLFESLLIMIEHKNPNIQTDLHRDSASSLKSVSTSILQFQISKITNVDLVRCKRIYTHM